MGATYSPFCEGPSSVRGDEPVSGALDCDGAGDDIFLSGLAGHGRHFFEAAL
jgi:hypothetical protein